MRILVVEDHPETGRLLEQVLKEAGYIVESAADLASAAKMLRHDYDAVVLDWMLPDGAGIDLCRTLRGERRDIPILMLTARGDVTDRVAGLNAGADDYLRKPFAVAELTARLRAITRRHPRASPDHVRVGAVEIHRVERRVCLGEQEILLTVREYALLDCLLAHEGRAVSRATILREVWGAETAGAEASLEVLISRLRKKLSTKDVPIPIRTHRGKGYSLEKGS